MQELPAVIRMGNAEAIWTLRIGNPCAWAKLGVAANDPIAIAMANL